MKIQLICIGKTDDKYLIEGIEKYLQRLKHYTSFKMTVIPDLKNAKHLSEAEQKAQEAKMIQKHLLPADWLVLLDERGEQFTSKGFSTFINKKAIASVQQLVFVIGGPYGFDDSIYQLAKNQLSLSKMTFSHQMVRLFFVEQLYRAFTILKGEPYHHV
jgi:23S rRNA (pseudouridine1915-N3)-methyltransferase